MMGNANQFSDLDETNWLVSTATDKTIRRKVKRLLTWSNQMAANSTLERLASLKMGQAYFICPELSHQQ